MAQSRERIGGIDMQLLLQCYGVQFERYTEPTPLLPRVGKHSPLAQNKFEHRFELYAAVAISGSQTLSKNACGLKSNYGNIDWFTARDHQHVNAVRRRQLYERVAVRGGKNDWRTVCNDRPLRPLMYLRQRRLRMRERDEIYDRLDRPRLYGRGEILDALVSESEAGCTLFGLDGVGGAGKSELADRLAWFVAHRRGFHQVSISLSEWPTEGLLIAKLYEQLNAIPKTDIKKIESAATRFTSELLGSAKRIGAAAVADAIKYASDKVENIASAVKEELTGEKQEKGVASLIEGEASQNRRLFINEYLGFVADLGETAIICLDNYEDSEPSSQEFIRFLLKSKPEYWTFIVINNVEKPTNSDWSSGMASWLEYERGLVVTIDCLTPAVLAEFFIAEMGRSPSTNEIEEILTNTNGGRPVLVAEYLKALRTSATFRPPPNLDRLNDARRARQSAGARRLAELIACAPADRLIPLMLVEAAAARDDIADIGDCLTELRIASEIATRDGRVGFTHSSRHAGWRNGMTQFRRDAVIEVWLSVYHDNRNDVRLLAEAGLVQELGLRIAQSDSPLQITDSARALVATGSQNEALSLLDASWHKPNGTDAGAGDVIEHALIAAQTRLDLGRYVEAQEALRSMELSGRETGRQLVEADLIRLKLALRQNSYRTLWLLSDKIAAAGAADASIQLERQMVVNTAWRDLLDKEKISESADMIRAASEQADPAMQARANRSVARSLAKLGYHEEALAIALTSLTTAEAQDDLRGVGNAHLAIGEAFRYAGNQPKALEAYRIGEDLARGTGNRDSEIWCLLGQACVLIETASIDRSEKILRQVERIVNEPGYSHPLESAHCELLRAITKIQAGAEVDPTLISDSYARIGIDWPISYFDAVRKDRKIPGPIPI